MKILFLALALVVSVNKTSASEDTTKDFTRDYMEIINDYRASRGLSELELHEDMSKVAAKHSINMARGLAEFSHNGFSNRCTKSKIALGHQGNLCGEIIANGQKTAARVFLAWMNSPGHRAKIVEKRYTHTGFGFSRNKSGKLYWTQIFMEVK